LTKDSDTVIIGARPAGLALGASLRRKHIPFVMLERNHRIGPSWAGHYDRLHLHAPKGLSSLPYRPYPADYPRYPSRDQVLRYLEGYATICSVDRLRVVFAEVHVGVCCRKCEIAVACERRITERR
jgi:cation diffusion facilitator CzcD-associated flavoprotein CzcO